MPQRKQWNIIMNTNNDKTCVELQTFAFCEREKNKKSCEHSRPRLARNGASEKKGKKLFNVRNNGFLASRNQYLLSFNFWEMRAKILYWDQQFVFLLSCEILFRLNITQCEVAFVALNECFSCVLPMIICSYWFKLNEPSALFGENVWRLFKEIAESISRGSSISTTHFVYSKTKHFK